MRKKARGGKLRGDAARAARMTEMAKEAARSALDGEARRRTLLRVIATLVERLGGDVRLNFREVSGAPELGMNVENAGTPDAVMVFAVGDRDPRAGIIRGDSVEVHSWSPTLDFEGDPERTGLELRGKVSQIDEGHLLVVRLEQPNELGLERVVVPRGWARPLREGADVDAVADNFGLSPRVDAEPEPVFDGLEGAPRDELLRQLRHLRLAFRSTGLRIAELTRENEALVAARAAQEEAHEPDLEQD